MKKIYIFCVLLLLSNLASSQDTLLMSDGSRLAVKILDITNDKIQYKTWSNLNGPTWTKSLANIKSIRREKERNDVTTSLDFTECGLIVVSEEKMRKKEKMSGNIIVRAIDSIYDVNVDMPTLARRNLSQYMSNLPKYIRQECVEKYYLDQFNKAVANEEIDDIVKNGETYLYLGAEDELPRVIEVLAKVFAIDGNEGKAYVMIGKLKEYSAQNDNMLDEDIARLEQETYALLHPRRLEDDLCGKWVLLGNVSYKGFTNSNLYSPLILEINDVSLSSGAHLIDPEQKVPRPHGVSNPMLAYDRKINTSQAIAFDGQNKCVALQFASLSIKDRRWLTGLSHDLLEQNRDTRAKMNATIVSQIDDFQEQLAATAMTAMATATLDVIYKSLNTSSKTDNVYNMVLFPRTDNVLNAYVSHVNVKTITTENANPRSVYNEYVKDKRMRFVRWEEKDSIFFMSANSRPITLREISLEDPLFNEYRQIKRKHSLRNPAYFLPLIAGNVIGALLIKKGVDLDYECFERDANGDKIPNGHGGYLFDEKKLGKAVAAWSIGGILCFATTIAVPKIMFDNRKNAYMDINRRNLEKLRQKAKASMSISPSYDPYNNSLGANINLSF